MSGLNEWLNRKLTENDNEADIDLQQDGRLGPAKVVFDLDSDPTMVNMAPDKLTLQSQSAFSTIRANCCVFKGKWMYEVQLRSKGVMQIGWCSANCRFTQDTGVGDTRHSYGLDGSKQRIWHIYTEKYGPYWRSGDIFGVCLDMDEGRIEYYRNGVSLGEAFNDIERGPGLALFPAVSLAYNDSLTGNFGGSPFRHPVTGYKPLQQKPKIDLINANHVVQYLVNLARLMSQHKTVVSENVGISIESVQMLIAAVLVEKIAPFFRNSYVIEDKVFSYIRGMCVIRSDASNNSIVHPGHPKSILGTFLTLLWTFMEDEDMKNFLLKLINFIGSCYKETPIDLEYEKQRTVIVILTCICNHPTTRKYLLESKFFEKNCLPLFLYIKPPDEKALEKLLPDDCIWTEGLGGNKLEYNLACDRLKQCTSVLYTLQKNLILVLMNNTDGDSKTPSSRRIFLTKFRKYVMDNSMEHRNLFLAQNNNNYLTPTQPAVALSFLCILLDVTKNLFQSEIPDKLVFIKPIHFYDESFGYNHVDRIGGILSHLKKTFRKDLVKMLGEGHPVLARPEQIAATTQTSVITFLMSTASVGGTQSTAIVSTRQEEPPLHNAVTLLKVKSQTPPTKTGNMDSYNSLNEMLDCSIFYYYSVAHKYIVMIADLRDNIAMLSSILLETKGCSDEILSTIEELRRSAKGVSSAYDEIMTEIVDRFGQRKSVFAKRSMELARKQAWYRSVALGTYRRNLLCWMLGSIFETLESASSEKSLFSFVPETYINVLPILLDTVLDFSFHDMSVQHDLKASDEIVAMAAEFLAKHSADSRVVLASCKDALLQALGTVTCHEAGIKALERTSAGSQLAMGHALLRPYENRAWGQSNWLLLRFWLGDGFAYRESRPTSVWQGGNESVSLGLHRSRGKTGSHTGLLHHIAPACPSKQYQRLFRQILLTDEPYSTMFLNSVLTQLNWAFSEFILLLQEIQTSSQRADQQNQPVVVESRQLKICSMCFELTVSLMRSLEMILTISPEVVQDTTRPNSDLLLGRIVQLASQVLSRITIPPGCFQHVIDLCLPDLSSVSHFSIITASLGILLALMKDEIIDEEFINKIPRVSKFLLTEPSFQIGSLEFALGEVKTPLQIQNQDSPLGNLDQKDALLPNRLIKPEPPVLPFSLYDCKILIQKFLKIMEVYFFISDPCHIREEEIQMVKRMIKSLQMRQSMMSEITILSDDSICPICYAKAISAEFFPCKHQSCGNCIVQHLLNHKVCFYCKTLISYVKSFDGATLYENKMDSKLLTPPITP